MIIKNQRLLAAKIEGTVGTAETLLAADATPFTAFDVVIQPTAEFLQRPSQGSSQQLVGVVAQRSGTATFRTEWIPDGTLAVPAWADVLFPGVACPSLASGTFTPTTAAPGANVKTLTIGVFQGGRYKAIRGAVGNVVITIQPGQPIYCDWTFTGAWITPVDIATPKTTRTTQKPMLGQQGSTTIGGIAMCYSSMTIDFGNTITMRPCIASPSGIHSFAVTNRNINGTIDPESKLVATHPAYTDWIDGVTRALVITFSGGGNDVEITAPALQITNPQEGEREGLEVDQINYQLVAATGSANDTEFKIEMELPA